MKIHWEASDVKEGMRVRNPDCSETWMVGYDPTNGADSRAGRRYAVISMIDGMISRKAQTLEEVAAHFNISGVHPLVLVGEASSPQ